MSNIIWLSNHTFIYKGRVADLPDPRPFGHDMQEVATACENIDDELYEEFKENMRRFCAEEAEKEEEMQKAIKKLDEYDELIKRWAKEGKIKC